MPGRNGTGQSLRYPERGGRVEISWGEETINRGVIQTIEELLYQLAQRGHDLRTLTLEGGWNPQKMRWELQAYTGTQGVLERGFLNDGGLR